MNGLCRSCGQALALHDRAATIRCFEVQVLEARIVRVMAATVATW